MRCPMRFPKPAAGRESAPERSPESAGHSFGIAVFILSLFYAPEMIRPPKKGRCSLKFRNARI